MQRHFIPENFTVTTWETLQPFFIELENRTILIESDFDKLIIDINELTAIVSENMAWRYIKMTCDTTNNDLRESFNYFVQNIEPNIAPIANRLNKKINESPLKSSLTKPGYAIFLRGLQNSIDLFREENIPLNTQLQELEQKFGEISGAQSIEYKGETLTLQKASIFLKDLNRSVREELYHKIQSRRAADEDALNNLYSQLIALRNKVALNTGFKNYRDYKHQSLGRFDYSVQDCLNFHEAVKLHAVPLLRNHDLSRKEKLQLTDYRPWDTSVDDENLPPLKPFSTSEELIEKAIECFNRIDKFFGDCVISMRDMGRLDLDSRLGKSPGGYQYPLYETEVPFIFMNAVGLHRDLTTMVHEGGHAIHSFLNKDLDLVEFKSPPSEVAELASMSMELISMEHWDVFFENKNDLIRAKKQQLESVMDTLPWIAAIDKFQHWIYENPSHTLANRYAKWLEIIEEFTSDIINYSGLEDNLKRKWQVQLHLFEVPFYYIEYGFAQLGAIAVWRNYKQNPSNAIHKYKTALSLGYTKTIPQIYEAAGIKFDFSPNYIKELMDFVSEEYKSL
jgi:oligoendopeptidase F